MSQITGKPILEMLDAEDARLAPVQPPDVLGRADHAAGALAFVQGRPSRLAQFRGSALPFPRRRSIGLHRNLTPAVEAPRRVEG